MSSAELVIGTCRLVERWSIPDHAFSVLATDIASMGQALLNPPSVEGWHEGEEWIDSAISASSPTPPTEPAPDEAHRMMACRGSEQLD